MTRDLQELVEIDALSQTRTLKSTRYHLNLGDEDRGYEALPGPSPYRLAATPHKCTFMCIIVLQIFIYMCHKMTYKFTYMCYETDRTRPQAA